MEIKVFKDVSRFNFIFNLNHHWGPSVSSGFTIRNRLDFKKNQCCFHTSLSFSSQMTLEKKIQDILFYFHSFIRFERMILKSFSFIKIVKCFQWILIFFWKLARHFIWINLKSLNSNMIWFKFGCKLAGFLKWVKKV